MEDREPKEKPVAALPDHQGPSDLRVNLGVTDPLELREILD